MSENKNILSKKKCACGRAYDRAGWDLLTDARTYEWSDGSLREQRRCACGSHLSVVLVEPMDVDDLRRAADVLGWMRESFNRRHTGQELLRLLRVCWAGEWDVLPDEWTGQQVAEALTFGRVPRFEERSFGLHAVGVDDCGCRGCRSERRWNEDDASPLVEHLEAT